MHTGYRLRLQEDVGSEMNAFVIVSLRLHSALAVRVSTHTCQPPASTFTGGSSARWVQSLRRPFAANRPCLHDPSARPAIGATRRHPTSRREYTNTHMMIKVGDKFPSGTFGIMKNGAPSEITTDEVFKGQTVVICGVPGAFTGTCNARHLPGYVNLADKFHELGAKVACLATNDAFVMDAWMKMRNAEGKVIPLSDGDASLLRQMGLTFDTAKFGGVRAVRFSMIVQDGIVKALNVEQGGAFTEKSAAETALEQLKALKSA
jgi:peroxiredoxin